MHSSDLFFILYNGLKNFIQVLGDGYNILSNLNYDHFDEFINVSLAILIFT